MADALLNQFVSQGTAAERTAFTPDPPTLIAGPETGYFWFETDTGDFYGWNTGTSAWVKIAEATSVSAITALTGDVTATGPGSVAATIANNAVTTAKIADANVTLAKLANIATDSLIGRDTAGSGVPQNILLNATLSMDGSNNLQRAALTGDVTAAAGSNATTIANDAVTTAKILDDNVTLAKIANASANDKLLGSGNAGSGANYTEITLGSGLTMTGTTLSAAGSGGTYSFGITIDGGGSDITTGVKGFIQLPTTGTIVCATILSTDAAATAGSIVIDVWKDTYANYPPTDADSITAAAPPTLSASNKNTDATLTGWTTSVTALDIAGFNVDSCSGITRVTLIIEVAT